MNYISLVGVPVTIPSDLNGVSTNKPEEEETPLVEQIANAALPRKVESFWLKAGCRTNETCATCHFQKENGSC